MVGKWGDVHFLPWQSRCPKMGSFGNNQRDSSTKLNRKKGLDRFLCIINVVSSSKLLEIRNCAICLTLRGPARSLAQQRHKT